MIDRRSSQPALRVLHVIDGVGVGGAELVLVRLIEQLQSQGFRNTVVALARVGRLSDRLAAAGATIHALGFDRHRLWRMPIRRLVDVVREDRPNVVQGWMYHGNLAATVARRLAGCGAPLAWSIHNTLEPPPTFHAITRLALRCGARLSHLPRAIVYVSRASAPQHERLKFRADRSVVIPNGIDGEVFRPRPDARDRVRAELGIDPGTLLVGAFARWDPMKGHDKLFAAAGELVRAGGRLHLLLAGSGLVGGNALLAAGLGTAGLSGHASLLGERDDVERLLPALDCFVLPSIWGEAFSLALCEAMASGVPCVATDVGDSRWIVGDTGFVVPPGDVGALGAALRRLLQAPAGERERLGAAARMRIVEHFSLSRMTAVYADLYRRLVQCAAEPVPVAGGEGACAA